MGNMKETLNVFLKFSFQKTPFVFPWEKPYRNHKTCLEMGFSGGNTTQCQQCLETRQRMLGPKSGEALASTYGLRRSLDWVASNFRVPEEYFGLELGQREA